MPAGDRCDQIDEPGDDVTFSISITNPSPYLSITLDSIDAEQCHFNTADKQRFAIYGRSHG